MWGGVGGGGGGAHHRAVRATAASRLPPHLTSHPPTPSAARAQAPVDEGAIPRLCPGRACGRAQSLCQAAGACVRACVVWVCLGGEGGRVWVGARFSVCALHARHLVITLACADHHLCALGCGGAGGREAQWVCVSVCVWGGGGWGVPVTWRVPRIAVIGKAIRENFKPAVPRFTTKYKTALSMFATTMLAMIGERRVCALRVRALAAAPAAPAPTRPPRLVSPPSPPSQPPLRPRARAQCGRR